MEDGLIKKIYNAFEELKLDISQTKYNWKLHRSTFTPVFECEKNSEAFFQVVGTLPCLPKDILTYVLLSEESAKVNLSS